MDQVGHPFDLIRATLSLGAPAEDQCPVMLLLCIFECEKYSVTGVDGRTLRVIFPMHNAL